MKLTLKKPVPVGFSPLGPLWASIVISLKAVVAALSAVTESWPGTWPTADEGNSITAPTSVMVASERFLIGHSFRSNPVPCTAWPTTPSAASQSPQTPL